MATLLERITAIQAAIGVKSAEKGSAKFDNYALRDLIWAAEREEARNRTRMRNLLRTHPLSPPGTQ